MNLFVSARAASSGVEESTSHETSSNRRHVSAGGHSVAVRGRRTGRKVGSLVASEGMTGPAVVLVLVLGNLGKTNKTKGAG